MEFNRLSVFAMRNYGDTVEQVEEDEAEFWSLFGFVSAVNAREFAVCIGDFSSRQEAELIRSMLGY
jgi:hypothetical protein